MVDLPCTTYKHSPVFRVGGDEFVAVLQRSDYESRSELKEALEKDFEKSYSQEDKDPWKRCSASIGSADFGPGDTSFDDVMKRADQAMYEAKKAFKKEHGSYR